MFAAMNELTWRRVLEWEALHHDTCGDPKLLRFMGKPHDLRCASVVSLMHLAFPCKSLGSAKGGPDTASYSGLCALNEWTESCIIRDLHQGCCSDSCPV